MYLCPSPLLSAEYLGPESWCCLNHLFQAEPDAQCSWCFHLLGTQSGVPCDEVEYFFFCCLLQSVFEGGWSMKYQFGNGLVSSQEYVIYTWTFKDPGCTATHKTGNYSETYIVWVKPKCLARPSCRSWLTHSGAMGTQSMPKFRQWLSSKLQDILGFIYTPWCIDLKKTGRSGEEAQLNLFSCTGLVWWSQG